MAGNKKRLQGLIGNQGTTDAAPVPAMLERGTPYQLSTQAAAEPELPQEAGLLRAPLQDIARRYLSARQRSGEALLEAARWLSEARTLAEHGEWYVFLQATGTTEDTAERLLNIHTLAMQNPLVADAIRRNWLGQSVAALLARPSTPPEIVDTVLQAETPPQVDEVKQQIRQARQRREQAPPSYQEYGPAPAPQIPQFAGFEEVRSDDSAGVVDSSARQLAETRDVITQDAQMITGALERWHELAARSDTERQIVQDALEQILRTIQSWLDRDVEMY